MKKYKKTIIPILFLFIAVISFYIGYKINDRKHLRIRRTGGIESTFDYRQQHYLLFLEKMDNQFISRLIKNDNQIHDNITILLYDCPTFKY